MRCHTKKIISSPLSSQIFVGSFYLIRVSFAIPTIVNSMYGSEPTLIATHQ
jgi:hypothetical protein